MNDWEFQCDNCDNIYFKDDHDNEPLCNYCNKQLLAEREYDRQQESKWQGETA